MCDRCDITEVMAHYARALDDRNLEELRDVFAAEADFTMQDGERARGPDAIITALHRRVDEAPRHRHLVCNITIDVQGDQAASRSDWYLMMPQLGVSSWFAHSAGTYTDELVRTAVGWRIMDRVIRPADRDT